MTNTFLQEFSFGLLRDAYEFQAQHPDFLRFEAPLSSRVKGKLRDTALLLARRGGFARKRFSVEAGSLRLSYILANLDGFDRFYNLLDDEPSRQLMVALLRLQVLGAQHVRLPINNASFWKTSRTVAKYVKERATIKTSWDWHLNLYELAGVNEPLRLHAHPLNILNTFLLEQYLYRHGDRRISVERDDVVIDAGGCWGDTALYFADRVGAGGKVFSWEFVPQNLDIFRRNLALNPKLEHVVSILQNACGDRSGEVIQYCPDGPATSLKQGDDQAQDGLEVQTVSIDDFVKQEKLTRLNYIKMDIEGSELKALQGAEETLRRFKPKLAIALYHKEDDFLTIPAYLDRLGLQYKFFLDHFTIYNEETVLFAVA